MNCLGLKKNLRRCRNKTNFGFCRHHRFQPFVFIFTISSIIGVYAGLFQDLIRPVATYFKSKNVTSVETFKDIKNSFKIAILPFDVLENCQYKETNIEKTIQKRLWDLDEEQHLNLQIIFRTDQKCPSSFVEGEEIGKSLKADMVIWGDLYEQCETDTTQACLKYAVLKEVPTSVERTGKTEITAIKSMVNIKKGYLQKNIDLVIYTTLGFDAYYKNEFEKALVHFDQAYKQQVMLFLETFRAAHIRKDIDYLKRIYSDDAEILGLEVIEEESQLDEKIERIRVVSKSDYFRRLKKVFESNDFLMITFDEIKITQHPRIKDIVGISLRICWNSATYSDKGFLFLMLDFRVKFKPLIRVRAWQPKPFQDGSLVGLGHFEILR